MADGRAGGKITVLSGLFTYVFDSSNQAVAADEDKINKPYRPIPLGLLTPAGAMRRFWIAAALYTATGWMFGVLEWVALWQVSNYIINLCCPPRQYYWCKTLCMAVGVSAQLAQAWRLVTPIDATGRKWILFVAIVFPPPLIFEDVRDMAGDKAAGRRSFALLLGEFPVRIWFATIMLVMPFLEYIMLFGSATAAPWRVALCSMLVATVCWTAGVRSLALRNVKADRVTHQLFIFSYIVFLWCACILWA